ncbi:vWA domain-containing protein [Bradymonas sediminis]|uniref:VWA domain-containing protein n=1 Tax=Bradymonas sediminis TaxID=1548548 RepID=A0A2Z4FL22_9DELT|nr:VWA domain-containing protein [Bradymonas sediminis]AWV89394.1 VWA domain-containing protein [Bradymonas sediminis]TDP73575.1 Ca-activated chloride channel family protein [Bradymonas sediminis]
MSFSFAHPWVLALLILVPALAAYLFMPRFRRRQVAPFRFSGVSLLKQQKPGIKSRLQPLPDILFLAAITLLIVAMARPQNVEVQEVEVEGIDIYLTLDMSGSMRAIDQSDEEVREILARGKQPDDRFKTAVSVLENFIKSRKYDRIGMVVFARDAYLQFPLTLDYNTILGMLADLDLGDIDPAGTAIGNAIGRAVAGLQKSEARTKVLILITDGDRRGGNISPTVAADLAKKLDIVVFPILVGRDGPVLVPVEVRGLAGKSLRFQKTEFPVNPELLQEIADITGGEYYRAADGKALQTQIHQILDRFERDRIKGSADLRKHELFHHFAIWAIVLLFAQMILRYTYLRTYP